MSATRSNIILEQLIDAKIKLDVQDLLTDSESAELRETIQNFVKSLEERPATQEQIEWNLKNSI